MPLNFENLETIETVATFYRGFVPTIDSAECAQRGLIESWTKASPDKRLTTSDVRRRACGWKRALAGRKSREFADVAGIDYAPRSVSPAAIDLASEPVAAALPVGQFGDEPECLAALAECLSVKGKARLARVIDSARGATGGALGGNSLRALRGEISAALPEWRKRMESIRAEWQREGAERMTR